MAGIDVFWHNDDKQMIIAKFGSEWDWDTYEESCEKSYEMINTISHSVVEIYDLRDFQSMPDKVFTRGRRAFLDKAHPQITSLIIVGINNYLAAVYNAFERMLPPSLLKKWNIVIVNTMDEAIQIAQQRLD